MSRNISVKSSIWTSPFILPLRAHTLNHYTITPPIKKKDVKPSSWKLMATVRSVFQYPGQNSEISLNHIFSSFPIITCSLVLSILPSKTLFFISFLLFSNHHHSNNIPTSLPKCSFLPDLICLTQDCQTNLLKYRIHQKRLKPDDA